MSDLERKMKQLVAELDATKSMFNEATNSNLQLRTAYSLLQNSHAELEAKLLDAKNRICELEKPLVPEEVAA